MYMVHTYHSHGMYLVGRFFYHEYSTIINDNMMPPEHCIVAAAVIIVVLLLLLLFLLSKLSFLTMYKNYWVITQISKIHITQKKSG